MGKRVNVVVIVASRHDGTLGIADALADGLREHGVDADVTRLDRKATVAVDLAGSDAVVLGSAVYDREWMQRAQTFVDTHRDELHDVPVWLFSAGARYGSDGAEIDPAWISQVEAATDALGHHVFLSRIDTTRLTFGERFIAAKKGLPSGDFRDWDDIAAWAAEIAAALGPG